MSPNTRNEKSGNKKKEALRDSDSIMAKIEPQYVQKQNAETYVTEYTALKQITNLSKDDR